MIRKFLLFILLVYSKILFSAEVNLRSENVFICDLLNENQTSITISFKDKIYIIPKSEILSVNPDKTGIHFSYTLSTITLTDRSVIKGQIIDETPDMVSIKKEGEIIAIPRDSILDFQKANTGEFTIPESYQVIEKEKKDSSLIMGIYGLAFRNGNVISDYNYSSYGGGIYIEPSFLKINEKWLFGLQSEFFATGGRISYSFFQNFIYLNYNQILFNLNFYYKLGIGSSYVSLTEGGKSANALRMGGTMELGWQKNLLENYIFKIGIRANVVNVKPDVFDMIGVQVSVGYKF